MGGSEHNGFQFTATETLLCILYLLNYTNYTLAAKLDNKGVVHILVDSYTQAINIVIKFGILH